MLFNLFTSLVDQYSFLNVFRYLTFRTGLAVITSLVVVFIIGGPYGFSDDFKTVRTHRCGVTHQLRQSSRGKRRGEFAESIGAR